MKIHIQKYKIIDNQVVFDEYNGIYTVNAEKSKPSNNI